jgi:RNA polymerase sigma-70 factor (ECF subfamily)
MVRMDGGDAADVAQALAGDRDAFRALVERHSRTIFRLAYRMTGNEQDAEEIVQDTFLRAYRRLDRFESRENFGTWLYRIAVNCSLDLRRKRRPEIEHREPEDAEGSETVAQIPSAGPTPDRLLLSAELDAHVQKALLELSPMERSAFLLRHFEGLSIEELGQTLGLRTSATKNTVFRAVQKLRRTLEPLVRPAAAAGSPGISSGTTP